MKKTLQKAIEAQDIPKVREIITEALAQRPGNKDTLELVQFAVAKTPGLFVKDDGKTYPKKAEHWTDEVFSQLQCDLLDNFSSDKLKLFTDISTDRYLNPKTERTAPDARPGGKSAAESAAVAEEIVIETPEEIIDVIETAPEPDPELRQILTDGNGKLPPRRNLFRIIGYVFMCLGVICTIVGLCIPVTLMIGLGIAVFMIATVPVYLAIKN